MRKLSIKLILLLLTALFFHSCSKEETSLIEPEKISTSDIDAEMATSKISSKIHRPDFILGINGHPLGTKPYTTTSATTQIKLLKDMGMTYYRFDVMSMDDGRITVPYLFEPLRKAAEAGGIKLLPMLYTKTLDFNDDTKTAYKKGRELGSKFASHYAKYFTYYNLGNEIDNKCIIAGKPGKSRDSFYREKVNVAAAYLKGMDEGIKSEDPGAKTMVDGSWLHYGFLRLLEDANVKFDIVAWHWYSEMEGMAANKMYNIPDITKRLADIFPDKPIWFTEVNKRHSTSSTFEKDQDIFLDKFTAKCKNNPQVKALIVYELFDDPNKYGQEAHYGIIKWDNYYKSSQHKIAADGFMARK